MRNIEKVPAWRTGKLAACGSILGLTLMFGPQAFAVGIVAVHDAARENDPSLKSAAAQLEAVRENKAQALANFLPNISARVTRTDGSGARVIEGFPSPPLPDTDQESWGLTLNQSVYRSDNYLRMRQARKEIEQAESNYTLAHQDFLLRVVQRYFDVLTASDGLEFAKAEEKAIGRQLEQAKQRFEVGLTAITDVHEAQASFDSARAGVILQQNVLDDSYEALEEISGSSFKSLNPLRAKLPLLPPSPSDLDAWVERAMDGNPSLAAAMAGSEVSEIAVKRARSGHLPTLDLTLSRSKFTDNSAQFTDGTGNLSDSFGVSSFSSSLGLQLNIPIYSGGLTSSLTRQAVHNLDASEQSTDVTRRLIRRQAKNAFRGVLASISETQARQQAVVSAQSALEATEAGFEVGTRTIVDVLLSQRGLFQARKNFSQARHGYVINHISLYHADGSLVFKHLQEIERQLAQ